MKWKKLLAVVLLVFVAASVSLAVVKELRQPREAPPPASPPEVPAPRSETRVVVYYFHGNFRCPTCRAMEAYTREAVETGFKEALEAGELAFKIVNVEQPANQHFIGEFALKTRSVVVARMESGSTVKWANLEDIWQLVQDKEAFLEYIQNGVRSYLGEGA